MTVWFVCLPYDICTNISAKDGIKIISKNTSKIKEKKSECTLGTEEILSHVYLLLYIWLRDVFFESRTKNDINIQHEKNLDVTVQMGPFNELFLTT